MPDRPTFTIPNYSRPLPTAAPRLWNPPLDESESELCESPTNSKRNASQDSFLDQLDSFLEETVDGAS